MKVELRIVDEIPENGYVEIVNTLFGVDNGHGDQG